MSITDELRFYVCRLRDEGSIGRACEKNLLNIADRIDAEHAEHEKCCKALDEAGEAKAWNEGFNEGLARADTWMNTHKEVMAEHGWVKLPVDADEEVIHVGDRMAFDGGDFVVESVDYGHHRSDGVDGISWMVWGDDADVYVRAEECWHDHKQPDTWECILEDAIRGDGGNYGCLEERLKATVPSLVARCKALAGEEER